MIDYDNIFTKELIYYTITDDYVTANWSKSPTELESISMKSLNRTTHHNLVLNKHSSESTILRSKAFLKFEELIQKK